MRSQSQSPQSGELTSDDLQKVFEVVHSITPDYMYVNFGMKLNVPLNPIRVLERHAVFNSVRLLARNTEFPFETTASSLMALRSTSSSISIIRPT